MEFEALFGKIQTQVCENRIPSLATRAHRLKRLLSIFEGHHKRIQEALWEDFRKPALETDLTEVMTCRTEIQHTLRNLAAWMKPQRVPTPLSLFGTTGEIRYEPKGVVLVISPWNYPVYLAITPLVSAFAAGNRAMLKPSELTPATSGLLKELLSSLFDPLELSVIEGGPETTQKLLTLPFDHIFFTGSTRVGRVVAEAAARTLTPVTLELGGKSPAVVDETADLSSAAKRIIWGKFLNGGQTCVAPDTVLVAESVAEAFLEKCKDAISKSYGSDEIARSETPDFCRIVTAGHAARLSKLVSEAVAQGAKLHTGGPGNPSEKFIPPTLLSNLPADCALMKEEIFGPILPIMTYKTWEEAKAILRLLDRPLAYYVFSQNQAFINRALDETASGGACVNSVVLHLANPDLPFGGIGPSGMGNYHGLHGFRTFSHERAVFRETRLSTAGMFRPPYTEAVKKRFSWVMKLLS